MVEYWLVVLNVDFCVLDNKKKINNINVYVRYILKLLGCEG